MELTNLEAAAISLIVDKKASFFDDGVEVGSSTYTDDFTDDMVSFMGLSQQAAGGVLSSLIKKGVFSSTGEEIYLTELGVAAAK